MSSMRIEILWENKRVKAHLILISLGSMAYDQLDLHNLKLVVAGKLP